MAMPAIQALGVAYEVYAVTDASGGVSAEVHEMAVLRMEQAGVVPITWFAVVGELRRDWARLEPAVGLAEVLAQHAGRQRHRIRLGDPAHGHARARGGRPGRRGGPSEFLPRHRVELKRMRELLATARQEGRQRLVSMNEPVEGNPLRIIDGLETLERPKMAAEPLAAAAARRHHDAHE